MASLLVYIILILLFAGVIVCISVLLYNRHLDKVTKGEIRDTHSSIPEPKTTAGVAFKMVLMVIVIMTFITVSTVSGIVSNMQGRISSLESDIMGLQGRLYTLQETLDARNSRIEVFETNVGEADFESNTVPVSVRLILKEYTDETKVKLLVADNEYELTDEGYGVFTGNIVSGLFDVAIDPQALISEPGRTYSEIVDYPSELFYEFLPMAGYNCSFTTSEALGKMNCSGEYTILVFGNTDTIAEATLTYFSDGQELKTMDVKDAILNSEQMTLEKGLDIKNYLAFRLVIVTDNGYRIDQLSPMIFNDVEYPEEYQYERVYGPDGTLLWENNFK